MEDILKDLEQLTGVEHGCVYHGGRIVATTFPQVLDDNLAAMGKTLEQIFSGVESIGRSHNEIYLELDENYLLGYRIDRNLILTLLTSKQINFSLLHISVRSAGAALKEAALRPPDPVAEKPAAKPAAMPSSSPQQVPEEAPSRARTVYRGVFRS